MLYYLEFSSITVGSVLSYYNRIPNPVAKRMGCRWTSVLRSPWSHNENGLRKSKCDSIIFFCLSSISATDNFFKFVSVSAVSSLSRLRVAIVSTISSALRVHGNLFNDALGHGSCFDLRHFYFQLRARSSRSSYGNFSEILFRLHR